MTRQHVTALSLAAVLIVGSAMSASADCSGEVALAVEKQGQLASVRKETRVITEQGPVAMTIEYLRPDRLRQVTKPLIAEGRSTETVLVGKTAWINAGDGWKKLEATDTNELMQFLRETTQQGGGDVGNFSCMGAETIDGRQVRAYRGLPPTETDKPKIKGAPAGTAPASKNEAVRVIYIDVEAGLPARSIFAREGMLDKPIFREDYTYPADLKIEPPAGAPK